MPPKKRRRPRDLQEIVADQIEDFVGGLARPRGPATLHKQLRRLTTDFGDEVRQALRDLLCDERSDLRPHLAQTMGQGVTAAVAVLAPRLVSQFGLAPATAIGAATLVFNALASGGQEALCAALARKPRRRKAPAKAAARPKPRPRPARPAAEQRPAPRRPKR